MLAMMYNIKSKLAPSYLSDLIPPDNKDHISYNLRNSEDIAIPQVRLESYKRSFFLHSVPLWNKLPLNVRQLPTLNRFKSAITNKERCNTLYYYGKRWPSIHHARIRLGCSKLRDDLYRNLHVAESSQCACGYHMENAYHFFIECSNYSDLRQKLFNAKSCYCSISLDIILHGSKQLTLKQNHDAVHNFIDETNRFI